MQPARRACFFCGYDLRGIQGETRCPECGKRQHEARDVIDYRAVGVRRTRWLAGAVVVGAVVFFFLFAYGLFWLAAD